MNFKSAIFMVMIGASSLLLGGCLKDNSYDSLGALKRDIQTIQDYISNNGINARMDSSTGVFYEIHKRGDGYKAALSASVLVHFAGSTLDGTDFYGNFSGSAYEYVFGHAASSSNLTQGFDIGLSHLHEGDSATFYVPSPYGYQDKQVGNVPANSILVYTVKFDGIKGLDADNIKIDQYISDHSFSAQIDTVYGTRYVVHKAGTGARPVNGDKITTGYEGQLLDGTVFDSSYGPTSQGPLDFTMGAGQVITGFELGFRNLHVGDSATIFIPPVYGYGDQAAGKIPANSVLVMGVDFTKLTSGN